MNTLPAGIRYHSTPGHGYLKISQERLDYMKANTPALLTPNGYYHGYPSNTFEEDLEYCRVILAFPGEFTLTDVKLAVRTFRDYNPIIYSAHTGRPVKPEHSFKLRQMDHVQKNQENYLTIGAMGDWHKSVPEGYVGLTAKKGKYLSPEGYNRDHDHVKGFLIPQADYEQRENGLAYVIPPNAQEWNPTRPKGLES